MRHSRFAVSRPGVSQGADAMESTIDTLQNEKLSSHDESAKLDPVLLSPEACLGLLTRSLLFSTLGGPQPPGIMVCSGHAFFSLSPGEHRVTQ